MCLTLIIFIQYLIKNWDEEAFENNTIIPIKLDSTENLLTAKIISSEQQILFEVDFCDGTFSTDMQASDLIVINPKSYQAKKIFFK